MCRGLTEGGRRCPCNRGARRRAYQRARYAAHTAEAQWTRDVAATLAPANPPVTDAHGAEVTEVFGLLDATEESLRTKGIAEDRIAIELARGRLALRLMGQDTVGRAALTSTRIAAVADAQKSAQTIAQLRETKSVHFNGPEFEEAMIMHGHNTRRAFVSALALAEGEAAAAPEAMKESDYANFARTLNIPGIEHVTTMAGARSLIAMSGTSEDRNAWNAFCDSADRKEAEAIRARAGVRTSVLKEVLSEISGNSHGGVAVADAGGTFAKGFTKKDQETFNAAIGVFPDGMLAGGIEKGNPLTVKKTKARAHYVGSTRDKKQVTHNLYVPVRDLLEGERHGYGVFEYGLRTADPSDAASGWTAQEYRVDDTPDNRTRVQKLIDAQDDRLRASLVIVESNGKLLLRNKRRDRKYTEQGAEKVSHLTTDGSVGTTVHEMAHRIEENNPEIAVVCRRFLHRRAGENATLRRIPGHRRDEVGFEDHFVDPYMGKLYRNSVHTEVFSTGVEALAAGHFGGLTGTSELSADPEHAALILGILSAPPTPQPAQEDTRV